MHEHEVIVEQPRLGRIDEERLLVDADTELAGRCPENVCQRRRRCVAHPGVAQLADRELAPVELVASLGRLREIEREQLVLPLQLPVGGVGDDVGADRQGGLDLGADRGRERPGLRLPHLPQAGEARHRGGVLLEIRGRGVDQAGAAAVVDAEQRPVEFRRDDLLGMPGGMLRREKVELVLGLGEDFADELAEAGIEIAARWAAGLGEHEAPLVDVAPEARAGVGAEFEGRLAGDPQHRRLEEILERRRLGLDDVPGESGGVVLLPA